MSALNFLNEIESKDIQIMSISKPKDELTLSKNEANNEETVRVALRLNINEEPRNVELDFHLSEELKHITFASDDLELIRRKVNPFQIKLFLIELFPMISKLEDTDDVIIAHDVAVKNLSTFLRRYSLLLNFYHQ